MGGGGGWMKNRYNGLEKSGWSEAEMVGGRNGIREKVRWNNKKTRNMKYLMMLLSSCHEALTMDNIFISSPRFHHV